MRVGSDIKFKGFLRNLGKVSEHFARNNGRLIRTSVDTSGESENGGEMLMPWFTVFEIEVVKQIDELPTAGYNRQGHHHLHRDGRYKVKTDDAEDSGE